MSDPRFNSTKDQALNFFKSNQVDMAKSLYEQILQNDNTDFDSHFMLGVIAFKEGNNSEATKQLNEAVNIREKAPGALYQLAIVYANSGENKLAIDFLLRAISSKSDYYDAYITLLKILSIEGRFKEIIKYCDEAITVMPERSEFISHRNTAIEIIENPV